MKITEDQKTSQSAFAVLVNGFMWVARTYYCLADIVFTTARAVRIRSRDFFKPSRPMETHKPAPGLLPYKTLPLHRSDWRIKEEFVP